MKSKDFPKEACVFYREWFDAIRDLSDNDRLMYMDAILNYALYGERIEKPDIALKLIYNRIDRDIEKYDKTTEQRQNAVKARWDKQRKKAEEDKPNDTGNTKDTAVSTEYERNTENTSDTSDTAVSTECERNTKNTDGYGLNTNTNTSISTSTKGSSNKFSEPKKIPLSPKKVATGGMKKNFRVYVDNVAAIKVPPMAQIYGYADQYRWRLAEGFREFELAEFEIEGSPRASSESYYRDDIRELLNKYQPQREWQEYLVAKEITTLREDQKREVCQEIDRASELGETNLWGTMLDKIKYIKADKVESLSAFLRARKPAKSARKAINAS